MGSASAIECQDTLLKSDVNLAVSRFGLDEVVAVATTDAVLVAHSQNQRFEDFLCFPLMKNVASGRLVLRLQTRGWYET